MQYIALQNDEFGRGPLASYFAGESIHSGNADSFTGNMYLAEDRVLCFEIVCVGYPSRKEDKLISQSQAQQ